MIEIESRELADIPVLHAYPVGQKDTPLPCVIFGNDSNLLIVFYVQIMPDDFVMQLHRF